MSGALQHLPRKVRINKLNRFECSVFFNSKRYLTNFWNFRSKSRINVKLDRISKRKLTFRGKEITGRYFVTNYAATIVVYGWGGLCVIIAVYMLYESYLTQGFTKHRSVKQVKPSSELLGDDDWTLIDHNGKIVTKQDLVGKYYLIYFGFTFCPDVCPIEMDKMSKISNILKERGLLDEIIPIFVSVDYRRDNPKMIKQYLTNYKEKKIKLNKEDEN